MRAMLVVVFLFLGCSASDGASPGGGSTGGAGGSAGSGGSGDDSSAKALADCKQACVKLDAQKCFQNTPGECDKLCEQASTKKACASSFAAYSSCAKDAAWMCDGGLAQAPDCAKQQQELATCLSTKGTGSGTVGTPGNFFCPNAPCDGGSSERACCVKLDFTKGVSGKCVSSIDQCGEDSRWECDGPDDCGGRACCWSNPSSGMGQIVLGFCRDKCNPLAGEKETCQDACTGGLFCCKQPGDDVGECVQSADLCKPKDMNQN